jgi:hypothetical protein
VFLPGEVALQDEIEQQWIVFLNLEDHRCRLSIEQPKAPRLSLWEQGVTDDENQRRFTRGNFTPAQQAPLHRVTTRTQLATSKVSFIPASSSPPVWISVALLQWVCLVPNWTADNHRTFEQSAFPWPNCMPVS